MKQDARFLSSLPSPFLLESIAFSMSAAVRGDQRHPSLLEIHCGLGVFRAGRPAERLRGGGSDDQQGLSSQSLLSAGTQ